MDEPITDVVFVTDEKDTPQGYKVLTRCPDQHSANLWQKFLGAKSEIRYICYTKEDKDGTVVEDMYIPGSNERYIMKGYTVVKRTVTGEDSLNLKYLAIKKSPRRKAKKAVLDLAVFRSKDKPASIYKKLGAKLNGLYICIRLDDLKDKATSGRNTVGATSSTSPPPPSSSSPHQTAPSSKSSQPSPPPSSLPQPSPPPSTSPLSSAPPHAEFPSSSPPRAQPALASVTPPPVATVPDSSTYPVSYAVTQSSPPPTASTYDPEQFTSSTGPSHTNPSAVPGPSFVAPAPTQAPPYDATSFTSAPVGSGNGDRGAVTASEVHTVALGFELLDLDQPIPESFQQLADSPPESDDEFSPSEFYQDRTGGYSQELQVTRSHTIGHGSGPVTASSIQKRSGSMYSSSAHPPAAQGYPPPQPGTQGYPSQLGSQGYPPQPGNLGYSPQPSSQGYPPQPGSQGYRPQPGSQGYPPQPGSQGYPPQPAGLGYPSLGYPPRPGNQGYPPPAGGQSYPPQGYPPPAGGSGYPPQPGYTNVARGGGYPSPIGFTGYNAGPAFGAAPVNPASSGPRPFNPYEQGRQAYPPTNTSYGFNI